VPGDDSYPGVFANGRHRFAIREVWMLFPQIVAVFSRKSRALSDVQVTIGVVWCTPVLDTIDAVGGQWSWPSITRSGVHFARWIFDHCHEAADAATEDCGGAGVSLAGRRMPTVPARTGPQNKQQTEGRKLLPLMG
jgi:hypothetical protein